MCGIAGYLGYRYLPDNSVSKCLTLMRRRGPDHAAIYRHERSGHHVALLHSRLSIIDLDARSNQPFQGDRKWIVYNGELYNYREVRQSLRYASGFTTESDTEVLLRKLQDDGWRGLDQCEGMWAFAMYDEADGSLLLCRDRFGEKPLYIYRDETGLYFGSEVKFIQALLGRRLEINTRHLYRYLVNGYKALYKVPETFFQGVSELPRATALHVNADGAESSRVYWQPAYRTDDSLTYDQSVEGVRERLIRAVELRLRADVPLAFCMSGGIDSNALISIAKRVFQYDVHGFTVVNEDARYEEQDYVDHAVKELGIRHTSVLFTSKNFLANLRTLVRQHDAPVYTISYYVHWLLMEQVAANGYRISVSGTAADEMLTGYYDHHNLYLYEIRNTPPFATALAAWQEQTGKIVRNPWLKDPRLFFDNPGFREHIYLNNTEFARYLVSGWHERFAEERYSTSLLRNRMCNELFHETVPVILHEDDLNAMFFSVENRSPFLDRSLFEFCSRIPTPYLVQDDYAKAVLRDAMTGIVPEKILRNRRKVGFNAPILSLLDVTDSQVRSWLLDDGPIFQHLRRHRIESLIDKAALPNSESKFLFNFVNAKLFLEEFSA